MALFATRQWSGPSLIVPAEPADGGAPGPTSPGGGAGPLAREAIVVGIVPRNPGERFRHLTRKARFPIFCRCPSWARQCKWWAPAASGIPSYPCCSIEDVAMRNCDPNLLRRSSAGDPLDLLDGTLHDKGEDKCPPRDIVPWLNAHSHRMGWTGGTDTLSQVELDFPSAEAAIAYAKRQGINFVVQGLAEPGRSARHRTIRNLGIRINWLSTIAGHAPARSNGWNKRSVSRRRTTGSISIAR